ncbi:Uncharacterised protein [Salmonella enterica subsp. enterica serovar Typhimurium str. DT104]|uniref:Uncharacterized protein n=2 Tax=Salmonella enterica I TaxID=59201 RepID=A0A8D5IF77_SALET|nr:hypothetical protein SE14_00304 [Salmonella enterica subsp. enterica serovar Typhimurium]ARV66981.1 hypothetical protein B6N26_00640 [Salmonella enterica subsp. enterica]CFB82017.1 Uncharacterised protein [Salmonella enterica subsp. enterica serovar Typhimurium str. DT104]SUF78906.1 Uncharacterised protein [Salmonella enterica]VUC89645.1 Uncharacterised protein [Salmonella sp. NCTC 11881]BCH72106.1 hypothetical protein SEL3835_36110 [Salmonella enterica subsp. enterica serovar 4,[5],12:i:-]
MLVRWDLFAHDQMNYIYSLYLLREFFHLWFRFWFYISLYNISRNL